MSEESHHCPKCNSKYGYQDSNLWICPECAHEWTLDADSPLEVITAKSKFLDANGVQLHSGDTVRTIKDLKIGSETIKSGTKVKGIRLLEDPVNDHDISCKLEGFGSIYLKCSVVRKN